MKATQAPVAWYRVPIAWLVFMIPVISVVGCMFTIYLAISNPDVVYDRNASDPHTSDQQ